MIKEPVPIKDVTNRHKEERCVKPARSFKALMKEEDPPAQGACISPFELMSQSGVKSVTGVDAAGVIDEIFHTLCDKMVYMESSGIDTLEVHYVAQSEDSALCDLTFTIEKYDTAPSEWNITFRGNAQGVELLTPEVGNLELQLRGQFENQAIRVALPELLQKERFGKRASLLSSEKTQERRWRKIQATGSAGSPN